MKSSGTARSRFLLDLANMLSGDLVSGQVDTSLTFDQIGGLDGHVDKLKEMIFLPLTYPELFERFHITPPRGMLFYGPPGQMPLRLPSSHHECRMVHS